MNSTRFLEIFKSKSHSYTACVLQYCRQFSAISQNVFTKNKLDLFTRFRWFLQGLPSHLQTEIVYQYELNPNDDLNMDFDDLVKKAMRLLGAKEKLASLVQVEKKSQEVENQVENCDYKTRISSTPNSLFMQSPIPIFQPLISSTHTLVQTGSANSRPVDKKIDHLTEIMNGLALSVQTL